MTITEKPANVSSNHLDFEDGSLLGASCKQVISDGISSILNAISEGVDAQGTADTPKRVANMYDELLSGYSTDPIELLNGAMFDVEYDEMVVVKDIDFYSLCEHHLLPFYGKAHVGYLPNQKVIGLSKMNRIVDYYARRPQVQERLGIQILDEMKRALNTEDVAVYIDAEHMCVSSRGISDQSSSTVTVEYSGKFLEENTKNEFLAYIKDPLK